LSKPFQTVFDQRHGVGGIAHVRQLCEAAVQALADSAQVFLLWRFQAGLHELESAAELLGFAAQQRDHLYDSMGVLLPDRNLFAFVFDGMVDDGAGDGAVRLLRDAHDLRQLKVRRSELCELLDDLVSVGRG
jgi:hypothetical protein